MPITSALPQRSRETAPSDPRRLRAAVALSAVAISALSILPKVSDTVGEQTAEFDQTGQISPGLNPIDLLSAPITVAKVAVQQHQPAPADIRVDSNPATDGLHYGRIPEYVDGLPGQFPEHP